MLIRPTKQQRHPHNEIANTGILISQQKEGQEFLKKYIRKDDGIQGKAKFKEVELNPLRDYTKSVLLGFSPIFYLF